MADISDAQIESLYQKLKKEATDSGYILNPDVEFTKELVKGLLENEKRYGYTACPCRLADGIRENDLDLICPCDYRDPDLTEYDACYCGLYISRKILNKEKKLTSIPERRPKLKERKKYAEQNTSASINGDLSYPVYRCKVCGYLCARNEPPEVCPICKVPKDRFERFI